MMEVLNIINNGIYGSLINIGKKMRNRNPFSGSIYR